MAMSGGHMMVTSAASSETAPDLIGQLQSYRIICHNAQTLDVSFSAEHNALKLKSTPQTSLPQALAHDSAVFSLVDSHMAS